jgi:hypothetical protein
MNDLDKRFEQVWRSLIIEGEPKKTAVWALKKRLTDARKAIANHQAQLLYAELSVAAGERVLKEHEDD